MSNPTASQAGYNNVYCQDNKISWFGWNLKQAHENVFRFVRLLIDGRLLKEIIFIILYRIMVFPWCVSFIVCHACATNAHHIEPASNDLINQASDMI